MSWRVVIPFKGTLGSKSRLAARFDAEDRRRLARAFLSDVVAAVRAAAEVEGVVLVSSDRALAELFPEAPTRAPVSVLPDRGAGLNAAVAHGIAFARAGAPEAHVAALLGDLPELRSEELDEALRAAAGHPLAFVPDAAGTGTSLITLAPGTLAEPRFGAGSAAAHAAAGFAPLDIPLTSGLRRDVDAPEDVDRITRPGAHTRLALSQTQG